MKTKLIPGFKFGEVEMPFLNVDAPGRSVDRRGVRLVQKLAGSAERKAAAQVRRDARRAKRAGPTAVVLFKMPPGGVSMVTPDGAYAWGGNPEVEGRWQVVVVGEPKGPPEAYRAALAAWLRRDVRVASAEPLPLPEPAPGLVVDERAFLSIILEPNE